MSYKSSGTAVNLTSIYANAEEAKAILKKIGNEAGTIRAQKGKLQKLSAATETCWKGLSGDALREKLAELIKEQEAIAKELEQDTRMMTKTIQQLEDEDASLAYAIRNSSSGSGRHV